MRYGQHETSGVPAQRGARTRRKATVNLQDVLDTETRCVLAFRGGRRPLASPMAYWYDGDALWLTTAASSVKARCLAREPACAVSVRAADGRAAVLAGQARLFSIADPVGVVVRAPLLAAALAALTARCPGLLLGPGAGSGSLLARWLPHQRVMLRITPTDAALVAPAEVGTGAGPGPALPPSVPAAVRRGVGGQRRVVVALADPTPRAVPAIWHTGYALRAADGLVLPGGAAASVTVDQHRSSGLPLQGLTLHGRLDDAGSKLEPERVTWWHGSQLETVAVQADRPAVVIPD